MIYLYTYQGGTGPAGRRKGLRKDTDDSFDILIRDISAGDIPGVVLLCGDEPFLVDWGAGRLKDRYVSSAAAVTDLVRFEDGELTAESFMNACETFPLLSERKVVIADSAADITGEILKYLEKKPPQTLVIIKASDEKASKAAARIKAAVGKTGRVYEFGVLSGRDLRRFIRKRFREAGTPADPDAVEFIAASCGYLDRETDYGLYNLENDIKKMAALAGPGGTVSRREAEEGLSDNLEHDIYRMMDAVCGNRKNTAFKLLHDMLLSGRNEYQILAALAGQFELMLEVRQMSAAGAGRTEIARSLKVHEFRVKKAAGFQSAFSEDDLRKLLSAAFEADDQIKSGLLSARTALELLIAKI